MKTKERAENGGRSQASMDRIQRPRESMPGCLSARVMERATVRLVRGAATSGWNRMPGTNASPTMSKSRLAVRSSAQKTTVMMAAWNSRNTLRQSWKKTSE